MNLRLVKWHLYTWSVIILTITSINQLVSHMRCRQNSIAAKWNIFLSFGWKVPFGFPCLALFCPSSTFALFFLTGSHHFGCRAPFWRPCIFASVSATFFGIGFRPAVAARPNFELEGLACFYDWKGGVSDFATSSWLHCLLPVQEQAAAMWGFGNSRFSILWTLELYLECQIAACRIRLHR